MMSEFQNPTVPQELIDLYIWLGPETSRDPGSNDHIYSTTIRMGFNMATYTEFFCFIIVDIPPPHLSLHKC